MDIWCFNELTKAFELEGRIQSEQIDRFRIFGGSLTIPNHDPHGYSSLGYSQRVTRKDPLKTSEAYWKYSTIKVHGHHVYDLIDFGPYRYAALGTSAQLVGISSARSSRWRGSSVLGHTPKITDLIQKHHGPHGMIGRMHEFFILNQRLYGITSHKSDEWPMLFSLHQNRFHAVNSIPNKSLFSSQAKRAPTQLGRKSYRLIRCTPFQEGLAYIAAQTVNDHQWRPLSLHFGLSLDKMTEVQLRAGELPYDLEAWKGGIALLSAQPTAGGQVRVKVRTTKSLVAENPKWHTLYKETHSTFARSLAISESYLYIGFGCDHNRVHVASGKIIRVPLVKTPKTDEP